MRVNLDAWLAQYITECPIWATATSAAAPSKLSHHLSVKKVKLTVKRTTWRLLVFESAAAVVVVLGPLNRPTFQYYIMSNKFALSDIDRFSADRPLTPEGRH